MCDLFLFTHLTVERCPFLFNDLSASVRGAEGVLVWPQCMSLAPGVCAVCCDNHGAKTQSTVIVCVLATVHFRLEPAWLRESKKLGTARPSAQFSSDLEGA